MQIYSKLSSVKKFYLLEYFYILLLCIGDKSLKDDAFEEFKNLKKKFNLGESKYKKKIIENDNLTKKQLNRYKFTFDQVIFEAVQYNLIREKQEKQEHILEITNKGIEAKKVFISSGHFSFNKFIFRLMEQTYNAFNMLVTFCYNANTKNSGLVIFPSYSPLKLNIERSTLSTYKDIVDYMHLLSKQLEKDILKYLNRVIDLSQPNEELCKIMNDMNLVSNDLHEKFDPKNYNRILGRIRRYWLTYFLNIIYEFSYSLNVFELWVYRAKQIGILHATEFFPEFSGKIIFPISIVALKSNSKNFSEIFHYSSGSKLFLYEPRWENIQDKFVKELYETYIIKRSITRNYYVNLLDIREILCYKLRISERQFDFFLSKVYKLNLAGKLKINISLESDRLPEETGAMYLKRPPVQIDNSLKNIIAIDIVKR